MSLSKDFALAFRYGGWEKLVAVFVCQLLFSYA